MPVLRRGDVGRGGHYGDFFWISPTSGPVFHSKSGPLCHPAHRRVMLSQQDILPLGGRRPLPAHSSPTLRLRSRKGHEAQFNTLGFCVGSLILKSWRLLSVTEHRLQTRFGRCYIPFSFFFNQIWFLKLWLLCANKVLCSFKNPFLINKKNSWAVLNIPPMRIPMQLMTSTH